MEDKVHTELLRELVQLARVRTYPVAREVLRSTFYQADETPRLKWVRAYAHMDGKRSQTAVGEAAGASQASVSTWSRDWQRLGLVTDDGRAVFDIYSFFPELEGMKDD